MFFSSTPRQRGRYDLVLEASRLADDLGFAAVWVPERHFGDFGGIFPNPAVMAAHLAASTRHIGLRAGSVITPLHESIRVAEEWSMVDNLSGGRVSVSIGSGWNANDFALAPDRFADRREVMWEQFGELRTLWSGGQVERRNGAGETLRVGIQPQPVQAEIPVWATSGGSRGTFEQAGRHRVNVLTHMIGQDLPALADNIAAYRGQLGGADGLVTLMLHTYAGAIGEDVRSTVGEAMRGYLRSALSLKQSELSGRGRSDVSAAAEDEEMVNELLDVAFDKYYEHGSLLGSVEKIGEMIERVGSAGVGEIACLVDFGLPPEAVLDGIKRFAAQFLG
ncbi:LLM class flavin-dependent oxidoreductase [Kutzneria sp. CA-103260]|nr:LLM class flavin-dependent oxidoreductase [Kutzneria sp. CA-103260]